MNKETFYIAIFVYLVLICYWIFKILESAKKKQKKSVIVLFLILIAVLIILFKFIKKEI